MTHNAYPSRVLEHAAFFKDLIKLPLSPNFDTAINFQTRIIAEVTVTDRYDADLNKSVFLCLGGLIISVPSNKQDPNSPMVQRWQWRDGQSVYHDNFLTQPLAPIEWLELFPSVPGWRLQRMTNGYGAQIFRTLHQHKNATLALTLACLNYAKLLVEIIKEDEDATPVL